MVSYDHIKRVLDKKQKSILEKKGVVATFTDQFMAGPMSAGGDSGSAILTEDNHLVDLLYAGPEQVTLCNKIENVFKLLHIDGI